MRNNKKILSLEEANVLHPLYLFTSEEKSCLNQEIFNELMLHVVLN